MSALRQNRTRAAQQVSVEVGRLCRTINAAVDFDAQHSEAIELRFFTLMPLCRYCPPAAGYFGFFRNTFF